MIVLMAACWQAAVAFAALYVGYKLYQHYHKPSKTSEKLEKAPPRPGFFAVQKAPAPVFDERSVDNRVENQSDVGGMVPAH